MPEAVLPAQVPVVPVFCSLIRWLIALASAKHGNAADHHMKLAQSIYVVDFLGTMIAMSCASSTPVISEPSQ